MKKRFLAFATAALAIATLAGCGGKTVDLNKYVEVEVTGYEGYGEVEVVWDEAALQEDFENLEYTNSGMRMLFGSPINYITDMCVDYDISADEALKNGDKVTLKWDVDEAAVSEAVDAKIKFSDITVTVKGLEEVPTFDAFSYVDVDFTGVSPSGYAEVTNLAPAESEAAKLRYTIDKDYGLKNGDTVTVTIKNGDNLEYMLNTVGAIPEKLTKEYTVKGLDAYATSLADISEEMYAKMEQQAKDEFTAHVAGYYDDPSEVRGFEIIGNYFLTPKKPDAYGVNQNYLDFVFKVTAFNQTTQDTFDYYWYCGFSNILVLADGTVSLDLTDTTMPNGRASWGSLSGDAFYYPNESWYYIGFKTIDDLFFNQVTKWVADYNYESTVK